MQKTAQKLLKENLYDFVGTDTHHHKHLKLLNTIGNTKTKKQIEQQNNLKLFFRICWPLVAKVLHVRPGILNLLKISDLEPDSEV